MPENVRQRKSVSLAAFEKVSTRDIQDIKFAQTQIRRFAEEQKSSMCYIEVETRPGVKFAPKNILVQSVAGYVPGVKLPMVAAVHMSVLTASVAGVPRIISYAPPVDGKPLPAIVAAMHMAGAHVIYVFGAIQAD